MKRAPVTYDGRTQTIPQWSRETGISERSMYVRQDKDYCPKEIIFGKYQRRQKYELTYNGITNDLRGWSKRLGVSVSTLQTRLSRGWSPEETLLGRRISNRRVGITVEHDGKTMTLVELAKAKNIKYQRAYAQYVRGKCDGVAS